MRQHYRCIGEVMVATTKDVDEVVFEGFISLSSLLTRCVRYNNVIFDPNIEQQINENVESFIV